MARRNATDLDLHPNILHTLKHQFDTGRWTLNSRMPDSFGLVSYRIVASGTI